MGIGRFALTPLLPCMTSEGLIGLRAASWLATANYLGYLLGSSFIAIEPLLLRRFGGAAKPASPGIVRWGLVVTAVATAGMALPLPSIWPLLRFISGLSGVFVLVHTSGWCLRHLAHRQRSSLGGILFTGPGLGIAISGLLVSLVSPFGVRSDTFWLLLGILLAIMTAAIWTVIDDFESDELSQDTHEKPACGQEASITELCLFVGAYGLAGLGYIVTATYLPLIVHAAIGNSALIDQFWPIVGVSAMVGALASLCLPAALDLRTVLAIGYISQAAGVALSVWMPDAAGFALSSILVGLPFTAITLFAMREARRLRPHNAAPTMGALSASFGIGQLIGPLIVTGSTRQIVDPMGSLNFALLVAANALVTGAAIFLFMRVRWPLPLNLHRTT